MAKFLIVFIALTLCGVILAEFIAKSHNAEGPPNHNVTNKSKCIEQNQNLKRLAVQYLNTKNTSLQQSGYFVKLSNENIKRLNDELTQTKLSNRQLIMEQEKKYKDLETNATIAIAERDAQNLNLLAIKNDLNIKKTENTKLERNLTALQSRLERKDKEIGNFVTKIIILETKLKELQQNFTEQEENLKIFKQNLTELVKKTEQNEEKLKVDIFEIKTKNVENKCPPNGHLIDAYLISLPNQKTFKVPCIVVGSDDQVWSIVERRLDQKISFNRSWEDYVQGFGDFSSEFFIGLEKLHLMTSSQPHELLIRLDNDRGIKVASYSNFRIGNATEGYAIQTLGKYSGDAGDGLGESLSQKFSTYDLDNDLLDNVNCASDDNGGWWQTNCGKSNLNFYHRSNMVYWNNFIDTIYSVEMLIRPTNIDAN